MPSLWNGTAHKIRKLYRFITAMNIKYCGTARDYSGYGEAVRHDIAALLAAGVEITTQVPHYTMEISDFGRLGDLAGQRENKDIPYNIKILHVTPNVYGQFFEPGKYHIGRVFWETDKLPADFAIQCEKLNEIWTGSQFNADAIRKAGVTKPIYIIPEAIDTVVPEIRPYIVTNEDEYKFYSIFEWTERKNPKALLRAYWKAFENMPDAKVSLTLKTYVDNFTKEKAGEIFTEAKRLKRDLGLKYYAPVFFYTRLMDRHQVYRFHKSFDCFVSAHRGEGWGIPQMEAALMRHPVISTGCGGIHEYFHNGIDAKLIDYKLVRLQGNSRNQQWYTQDQQWAEVDETQLSEAIKWAYLHQDEAKTMGEKGGKLVENLFSFDSVGNLMAKRLSEIQL